MTVTKFILCPTESFMPFQLVQLIRCRRCQGGNVIHPGRRVDHAEVVIGILAFKVNVVRGVELYN